MDERPGGPPGMVDTYRREVTRDAALDAVSARWAWVTFWTPAVGAVVVAASRANMSIFRFLVSEDHLLEWSQFVLLLIAALFGFLVAIRLFDRRETLTAVLFVIFGIGMILVAGEEISWGQRIFGWGTPPSLTAINNQGETNLHNVLVVQDSLNYLKMIGGLLAFLLPFFTRWSTRITATPSTMRSVLTRLSPALFLGPCFLLTFGYRFIRLFVLKSSETAIKFGEWTEFALYFGFAALAFLLWRRLARS